MENEKQLKTATAAVLTPPRAFVPPRLFLLFERIVDSLLRYSTL